jgi:hypothetical protein
MPLFYLPSQWVQTTLFVSVYLLAIKLFGPETLIGAILRWRLTVASPLPPGPKGFPLIGNLLDVPKRNAWETYSAWRKVRHLILRR